MNKAVKILAVTLVFFSLAIGSLIAPFGDTAQAASAFQARVTVSKAKVYTGPGKKYRSIGTLYRNTSVTVKGSKGSWYKISFKGKTRYIYNKNAKKIVRAKFTSYKAYVKSYSLKIRNKASSKYKTIRTVYMNTKITVIGQKNGYAYIYSGGKRGYVQKKWLKSKISSYKAYVTASTLNMRKGPGTKYKHVKYLHKRYKVTVSGYSGGWYRVKYGNKTGFVKAQYIKKGTPPVASVAPAPQPAPQPAAPAPAQSQPAPAPQPAAPAQPEAPAPQPVQLDYSPVANFTAYIGYDQLKMYQGPDSNSGVVTTLREKTAVTIIGQNGNWMKVRSSDGKEGFIYKDNLTTDLNRFNPPSGAYGIDISHYQNENNGGIIDFNAIKNSGNSFVIVKATEGETQSTVKQKNTQGETSDQQWTDYTFSSNAKKATEVGLKVHAYHFFRANSVNDAIIEADHFADILNAAIANGANIDYIFVDVETTNGIQNDIKTNLSNNTNAFLKEMRARGFNKLGIYSGLSFYKSYINTSLIEQPQGNPRLLVWIARYRGQDTNNGTGADFQVDIWQYSSNGSVNGINGAVDLNVSYYDPNAV